MIQLSIEAVPVQHHRERQSAMTSRQASAAGSEADDGTPIDENVNGWVWMPVRGWLELLLDAAIDTTETLGAKVWHRDRAVWMYVTGQGLSAGAQPAEAQPVDNNKSWYMNNNQGPKDRDGDVPEWDGKEGHRTTYFRRIDLWTATTGVVPEKQGVRLLAKLTGEAFEKLENVDPESLQFPDGVERFKKYIIEVYEPVKDYRIGKIMDYFLNDFHRKHGQEIIDYNLAWARELFKVEKVAGELAAKWTAHLYLTKMKLTPVQKTQILTVSLGVYTVAALMKAALTTFPSMKDAFGGRTPSGGREGYHAGNKKPPFRRFMKKKPFKAHETNQEDDNPEEDEDDEEEEEYDEDYDHEDDYDADGEEGEFEEVPDELAEGLLDAEALFTRAKKARAEMEKARGFFKKGAPSDGRKEGMKSLKDKMPCSKCGKLGHWHNDLECPEKDKPFKNDKGGGKGRGKHRRKKKKKKKKPQRRQHTAHKTRRSHQTFVMTTNGLDLPHVGYADTACAKSVVGQDNADSVVEFCKKIIGHTS